MRFSTLFSADVLSAAFDEAIDRDVFNGRVNSVLQSTLSNIYAFDLPASPAAAVKAINEVLASETRVMFAKGTGAIGGSVELTQALRDFAVALHTSGRVKSLPEVLPLPKWADPLHIATVKAQAEAKRKATAEAKAKLQEQAKQVLAQEAAQAAVSGKSVSQAVADAMGADAVRTAAGALPVAPIVAALAPAGVTAALQGSINVVIAALRMGSMTQAQIDAIRAAVDAARPKAVSAKSVDKGTVVAAAPWEDVEEAADPVAAQIAADAADESADKPADDFPAIDPALAGPEAGATIDGVARPLLLTYAAAQRPAAARHSKKARQQPASAPKSIGRAMAAAA